MTFTKAIGFVWCLVFLLTACGEVPSYQVQVDGGEVDRRGAAVTFELPDALQGNDVRLVDAQGREVPLRVDADGQATFMIARLEAGETQRFTLEAGSSSASPSLRTVEADGTIEVLAGEAPILRYQAEPKAPPADVDSVYTRGGYIHPVYTPSGMVITGDFPLNHLHHHGIWTAWTNTEFQGRTPDFWNMGDETGTVVPLSSEVLPDGPVVAGMRGENQYRDLTTGTAIPVLNETWEVRAYDVGSDWEQPVRVFEVDLEQTMGSDSTLVLPEYHYGGLGFRGHDQWNGAENTIFLTSEGRDRSDGHATRARWCHIGGFIDGHLTGIAILSHPDNFRHPQPMRIHPTEPFFCFAPSQLGPWAIELGTPYHARYRFVVYDGEPDAALIDELWNGYAQPPAVTVERLRD